MAKEAKRIGALPTSSSRPPDRRWPRTVTAIAARRPCSVSVPVARRRAGAERHRARQREARARIAVGLDAAVAQGVVASRLVGAHRRHVGAQVGGLDAVARPPSRCPVTALVRPTAVRTPTPRYSSSTR